MCIFYPYIDRIKICDWLILKSTFTYNKHKQLMFIIISFLLNIMFRIQTKLLINFAIHSK